MKPILPQARPRSNFELTIFAIIIFVFILLAIIKMLPMFGKVEKTYFEATLSQLELIVNVYATTQIMKSEEEALLSLVDGNPFNIIEKKHSPSAYIGELQHPNPDEIDGYQWYFDMSDNTLVYRVENTDHLLSSGPNPSYIKFKLILMFADKEKNGVFNKGIDKILGLKLTPQYKYEWRS